MTIEDAKVFLDNLKICINEHPVVADWLVEIANRKTENSSEKPNNCEGLQDWKDRMWAEAIVTEPTVSKMEQVDKDINVRSKNEPQIDCGACKHSRITCRYMERGEPCKYEPKDEPQTCSVNGRPYDCGNCEYFRCTADEPQTERSSE